MLGGGGGGDGGGGAAAKLVGVYFLVWSEHKQNACNLMQLYLHRYTVRILNCWEPCIWICGSMYTRFFMVLFFAICGIYCKKCNIYSYIFCIY